MIKGKAVYQRTESGRDEIRRKTHGLTQSERLVLILVDGVANVDAVRNKLKGVNDERYVRALKKLVRNNLVQEVLMPMAGQEAESIDTGLADLFLRQDALDPVTIVSADPEDEYDSLEPRTSSMNASGISVTPAGTVDLHLWKSKQSADVDPFPVIRTESRITPPSDLKPQKEPRPMRAMPSFTPHEEPPVHAKPPKPASARLAVERPAISAARQLNPPTQKDGSLWLFWIALTVLSILTTGFILFY